MLISVVNHTKGKLSDEQVQEGIRAVNRQIAHDFRPHWDFGAELRLEGAIGKTPDGEKVPELLRFTPDPERIRMFLHAVMRSCFPGKPLLVDRSVENAHQIAATLEHAAERVLAEPTVGALAP